VSDVLLFVVGRTRVKYKIPSTILTETSINVFSQTNKSQNVNIVDCPSTVTSNKPYQKD